MPHHVEAGPLIKASEFANFDEQIERCLLRDRWRFRRKLRDLRNSGETSRDLGRIAALKEAISQSQAVVRQRQAAAVDLTFSDELPVAAARERILKAIEQHRVLILSGETGSGKTTQLPRLCLAAGRGIYGRIGHTQPRRIAARAVARRVAGECGSSLGGVIGYQTRFDKQLAAHSRVKLMTDGILLSELRRDRWLNQYDTLIIDEAHERSLNIDFLLGYLRRLLEKRRDLKLIITSATLESEKFSRHFFSAPVLEISGRMYPVDIEYQADSDEDTELADQVAAGVERLLSAKDQRGRGDILVFLPGERQIVECRQVLRRRFSERLEVLPLFGRLSASDQDRVFSRERRTRCVLATNIAETSLTVPGIRYVIDTGLARVSRYSVRSKVQQLPIEKISQASARQRAGRCGRLENGLCLRLYSEEDLLARPEHTEPEILRTNLASVILSMASLRLGDVEDFPFVDMPDGRNVRDGLRLLKELEALDDRGAPGKLGRRMAELPLDPRIARMLLAAGPLGCLQPMRIIAAALSIPDPRQRPAESRAAADEVHSRWSDQHSDLQGLLALWREWREVQAESSRSALRRWCKAHYLSYPRMREWQDLVHQLHGQVKRGGAHNSGDGKTEYERLHRAFLTGLLSHVGERDEEDGYQGTRGRRFYLFPGSGLAKSKTRWVVAAQLIETSRLYAHVNARIEPAWIEEAAGHLVKRHYDEPRWDPASGKVLALETVTLYGLTLTAGRRVDYGPVDPTAARAIFIREALVANELGEHPSFLRHNQANVREVRDLEARLRRSDLLVDERVQAALYDDVLPAHVRDKASLLSWLAKAGRKARAALEFPPDALMAREPDSLEPFPDHLQAGQNRLALEYAFERGAENDGVTAVVPLALLNAVQESEFEYLVPGMIEEKLVSLLKGLPKAMRKKFVPVPDFARALLESLPDERPPLLPWMAARLQAMTGVNINASDLATVRLENHLRMNFRVTDEEGATRASGRELAELKKQLAGEAGAAALPGATALHEQDGIVRWDFGELRESIEEAHAGRRVTLYPALLDQGASVSLLLCDHPHEAERMSCDGIIRLAWLALPQQVKMLKELLRKQRTRLLGWRRHGDESDLLQQVFLHLGKDALCSPELPRTAAAYEQKLTDFRAGLIGRAERFVALIIDILDREQQVRAAIARLEQGAAVGSAEDAQHQLDNLLHPGFLAATETEWLGRFPVYLEALLARLEKLPAELGKDAAALAGLTPLVAQLQWLQDTAGQWLQDKRVRSYRLQLEELRVSLFAQRLGTVRKVSAVRLQRYWDRQIVPALEQAGLTQGH